MTDKLLNIIVSILSIAYGVGAPATFIYLIATQDHWTILNAIPVVILALLASSIWILYWPINLLFF